MIRFAWLQSRAQTAVALAGLLIVGIVAALTGPHLAHLYHSTIAPCAANGNCDSATTTFLRTDHALRVWLGILVIIFPGLIGIFWGAPLVARELEAGTDRLVWTQSISRTRWLAIKLAMVGLASVAVAGLVSLIVTWWASPLDKAAGNRFTPGVFDARGVVVIGYAALAFLLGVAAGMLIRRTLPAMASALAAFVALRLAATYWLRPHLLGAAHTSLPIRSGTNLGFGQNNSFTVGNPTITNAWVLSSRLVDNTGHTPTAQAVSQFINARCPTIANPAAPPPNVSRGPANQGSFQACIDQLSAKYHLVVSYQPARRYWTFQWYELAIFLAASLILGGFCFWWIHRRHA